MTENEKTPESPEVSFDAELPETQPVEPPTEEVKRESPDAAMPSPEELAELRKKAAEYDALYERFQRAAADFQNTQKRLQRQSEERSAFAIEQFAKELLGVSDDLSRAVSAAIQHQTIEAILGGLHLVEKDLYDVMARHGIKVIPVEPGDPFDPNRHEALTIKETTELAPNCIVEEIQKGFLIHQRLLRASRVIVSAPPSEQE